MANAVTVTVTVTATATATATRSVPDVRRQAQSGTLSAPRLCATAAAGSAGTRSGRGSAPGRGASATAPLAWPGAGHAVPFHPL